MNYKKLSIYSYERTLSPNYTNENRPKILSVLPKFILYEPSLSYKNRLS